MSNAKVRARRRRRGNRAWTKAMDPVVYRVAGWVPAELKETARSVLRAWHEKGSLG